MHAQPSDTMVPDARTERTGAGTAKSIPCQTKCLWDHLDVPKSRASIGSAASAKNGAAVRITTVCALSV